MLEQDFGCFGIILELVLCEFCDDVCWPSACLLLLVTLFYVCEEQGQERLLYLLGEGCVEAEVLEIMVVHIFVSIAGRDLLSESGVALLHCVHVHPNRQMSLHDWVLAPYNCRVKAIHCTYWGLACRNPMRGPQRSIALGPQQLVHLVR